MDSIRSLSARRDALSCSWCPCPHAHAQQRKHRPLDGPHSDIGTSLPAGRWRERWLHRLGRLALTSWNQYDEFRFRLSALTGDGVIIARVQTLSWVPWSKAGLIIRESLSPGSKHASASDLEHGAAFQHRGVTNDWTQSRRWLRRLRGTWLSSNVKAPHSPIVFVGWRQLCGGLSDRPLDERFGVCRPGTHHHSEGYASVDFTNVYATGSSGSPSGWTSTDVGNLR